ncbi:DUF4124 domain-containing protein [Methylophaga sp. OBS1]|uniref:DUF4124 domain-containing protein n=1 Tax=Methylophaga sp. OBS1 TaxID=2991933 RepID=UPI00224EDBFF|nr:DUF4124 domain-containing protein [Methylophaga sp. OBS1]MCX4193601.1 DUF4124 domain-containing protein [Methylophaga sp. OBS1]
MMIRKFLCLSTSLLLFACLSAQAGQLYRFPDENGVLTLSTSLPPEAAQKGYDIIDDKTMRVIKRVAPAPTEDELEALEAEKLREAERKKKQEIAAQEAEKARQKQRQHDRTLLITYPTEVDLLAARDKDINYRQEQIGMLSAKLPILKQRLQDVQKEAAERELSGGKITDNMQKRLDAAQEEIRIRQQSIKIYQAEIEALKTQYQQDLERLRYLRGTQTTED